MKKVTTLAFVLALAIGAGAQTISVLPNAHGSGVGSAAHAKGNVTNSTVPPAARRPNAVTKKK